MPYKNLYTHDLEGELWKPVNGFKNYEVSNKGRVKSIARKIKMPNNGFLNFPSVVMSFGVNNNDYLYVNLSNGGQKKTITIQRLVALHFVKNKKPKEFKIVRHLDNNKTNNNDWNLEWTNHSINNKQAWDDGLKVCAWTGKTGSKSASAKPVDQFTTDGKFIKRHQSRVDAANETGVPYGQINHVAGGWGKTAGGFIWRAV